MRAPSCGQPDDCGQQDHGPHNHQDPEGRSERVDGPRHAVDGSRHAVDGSRHVVEGPRHFVEAVVDEEPLRDLYRQSARVRCVRGRSGMQRGAVTYAHYYTSTLEAA